MTAQYKLHTTPYKVEHVTVPLGSDPNHGAANLRIPSEAVLLETLKLVELRLQRKGLLPHSKEEQHAGWHPLWFVAETERNIFLWRNGHSLSEADRFEFWVNPHRLITKRLAHLKFKEYGTPSIPESWEGEHLTPSPQCEDEYLALFGEILLKAENHLTALSRVVSITRLELQRPPQAPQVIVLPYP